MHAWSSGSPIKLSQLSAFQASLPGGYKPRPKTNAKSDTFLKVSTLRTEGGEEAET